jgi:hypothetical protein
VLLCCIHVLSYTSSLAQYYVVLPQYVVVLSYDLRVFVLCTATLTHDVNILLLLRCKCYAQQVLSVTSVTCHRARVAASVITTVTVSQEPA